MLASSDLHIIVERYGQNLAFGQEGLTGRGRCRIMPGPRILCQHATSIGGRQAIGGANLALGDHSCQSEFVLGILPQYRCVMITYVLPVSDARVVRSTLR